MNPSMLLVTTGVLSVKELRNIEAALERDDMLSSCTAKCDYCGRYGDLGTCVSCGAPNVPVQRVDVTCYGDAKPRYIEIER